MLHPLIKWAQRKDRVFIEIQQRDIVNENIKLTENSIEFNGVSDGHKYAFEYDLFDEINTEESKWNKTGFHLLVVLIKKHQEKEFWPRLLKIAGKNQYVQIDWNKWVDEDEEAEEGEKGLGGVDPSQMQGFPGGMGGMPGMGGMGMPGMGGMGMGMPGMEGMGMDDGEQGEQGKLDDLEQEQQIEKPVQPKVEEPQEKKE